VCLLSGALKSRDSTIPELEAEANKPRKLVFGIRRECPRNSVHPVGNDDEEKTPIPSVTLTGSERAPLLKGLCEKHY